MMALILTSANQWVGQARAVGLRAMGVEREGRAKAQKWLGLAMWLLVLLFACIGGVVADKLETLGAMCTLAVGWLVPAILFVKHFYLSSPLAIVFPSTAVGRGGVTGGDEVVAAAAAHPPSSSTAAATASSSTAGGVDILLARKERELQRRRTGRRLWQDLIVFVGILPIGLFTVAWLALLLIGIDI